MTRLPTRRFKEQLRHAYAHSPFYCRKLKAAGVTPAAIRTLDDLRKLPFTTKDELKENQAVKPPWGDVLAVPFADVLRVHMTSATTGRPLAFLDTREDWHGFYHSYARSLYAYGIRRPDVVMAAFSYGPWIGYWSGFYAAQDLGCLVFPVGGLTTDQRIDALLSYPITVLGCTPSYALFLAEAAGKGDRPRQASEGPHHVAHGRAGRLDPRDEGEDRGGVRREGVRPPRAHRDRRVGVRVRRARRARARARGLLLSRGPRRRGSAGRRGRARRAGLHEPLPEGDAAPPVPHARRGPGRRADVPVRPHAARLRGRRPRAARRHEEDSWGDRLPAARRRAGTAAQWRRRISNRLQASRGTRRRPGPHRPLAVPVARRVPGAHGAPRRRSAHRARDPRDGRGRRAGVPAPVGPQGQTREGRAHRGAVLRGGRA